MFSRVLRSSARCFSSEAGQVLKTAFYDQHVALGGKMVPFAGYMLPVQYKEGMVSSHLYCRKGASLWDVSHMGQLRILGKKRLEFLETITPADLKELPEGKAQLTCLTNARGGVIDDCMITHKNKWTTYMVVNAACKHNDVRHMREQLKEFNTRRGGDVTIEVLDDKRSLLCFQGPQAPAVVQSLVSDGTDLRYQDKMTHSETELLGVDCYLFRGGYTGEDGFEISIPHEHAAKIMEALVKDPRVRPAGLGVRDSIRLECALNLYGHELNEDLTPVEGAMTWTIGQRRRKEGGFLGADVILKQLAEGVEKKRCGIIIQGPPARGGENGEEIVDKQGNKIGWVTSGTFSPCLKKSIALCYLKTPMSKIGTQVAVKIRGKEVPAVVCKTPFVPTSFYKMPKEFQNKKACKH